MQRNLESSDFHSHCLSKWGQTGFMLAVIRPTKTLYHVSVLPITNLYCDGEVVIIPCVIISTEL